MTPKIWLLVVLIAVLAPVYLLFGVATSKNVKEMSEKNKEEYEKNRARHKYMLLGQSWGLGIGVAAGSIIGYFSTGRVSTGMCLGIGLGMFAGMMIGAMIDRKRAWSRKQKYKG
ncbi:glycine zipper domain-containing protein [Butyrivibrio sp. INlla16]|uniref:glycine zipper domain-containing protein n=1 Tax=Butyrivibrio sp. INlla16 TaxID=1520807 RepID=UPI000891295C|nr:glycine zipper domain-containing protein [Butyrivibrio sp. INlla16]SDB52401.1 Glycine zipper [Butyrivibrio sp. INlla16]